MKKLSIFIILLLLCTPVVTHAGFGDTWAFGPWKSGERLVDPDADRLSMWDDSAGVMAWTTEIPAVTAITGSNGQTIDFANDNRIEFSDNSETFGWIFGTDKVTWLAGSTGVATVDANSMSLINLGTLQLPSDESADGALATLGEIHIRGDEDRISYHVGAGGEVAGEVTVSVLEMVNVTFDPGSWYDSDAEVFLFEVDAKKFPNGIIIDQIKVSFNVDPDVELDADLRYADAWIGLGNAADIIEIDTTNGVFTEDTDANINGGSAIAAGKMIYIGMDADPEGTGTQLTISILGHAEED